MEAVLRLDINGLLSRHTLLMFVGRTILIIFILQFRVCVHVKQKESEIEGRGE